MPFGAIGSDRTLLELVVSGGFLTGRPSSHLGSPKVDFRPFVPSEAENGRRGVRQGVKKGKQRLKGLLCSPSIPPQNLHSFISYERCNNATLY